MSWDFRPFLDIPPQLGAFGGLSRRRSRCYQRRNLVKQFFSTCQSVKDLSDHCQLFTQDTGLWSTVIVINIVIIIIITVIIIIIFISTVIITIIIVIIITIIIVVVVVVVNLTIPSSALKATAFVCHCSLIKNFSFLRILGSDRKTIS